MVTVQNEQFFWHFIKCSNLYFDLFICIWLAFLWYKINIIDYHILCTWKEQFSQIMFDGNEIQTFFTFGWNRKWWNKNRFFGSKKAIPRRMSYNEPQPCYAETRNSTRTFSRRYVYSSDNEDGTSDLKAAILSWSFI